MLGFEITEEGADYVIIENVTEPSEEKQEVLVRRMFLIIKDSFDLLNNDLQNQSFNNLASMVGKTKRLNKYNSFCRRNITKRKFNETKETYSWELYQKLLLIQHSLWHFYEVLNKEQPKKVSENILQLSKTAQNYYVQIYEAFFKKDIDLLLSILEKSKNSLYGAVHKEMKKSTGKESLILYYLGELYRLVYILVMPMTALLLT